MFSIPVGVVYRPNEAKVRNLQQKDYLGKARLVAASDRANAFTGFAGAEMKQSVCVPFSGTMSFPDTNTQAKTDRPNRGQGRQATRSPLLRRQQPRQTRPPVQKTAIRTTKQPQRLPSHSTTRERQASATKPRRLGPQRTQARPQPPQPRKVPPKRPLRKGLPR